MVLLVIVQVRVSLYLKKKKIETKEQLSKLIWTSEMENKIKKFILSI